MECKLTTIVLSIIGVLLITNPLGPGNSIAGPGTIEDNVPTEPIYKLLGLAFAIPSTLIIGTDGMSNLISLTSRCLLTIPVVIMRKMGSQVGHVQILATLALAPAVITAWYAFHLVSSWRRADRDSILVDGGSGYD
jgi:hypothetical protein